MSFLPQKDIIYQKLTELLQNYYKCLQFGYKTGKGIYKKLRVCYHI